MPGSAQVIFELSTTFDTVDETVANLDRLAHRVEQRGRAWTIHAAAHTRVDQTLR